MDIPHGTEHKSIVTSDSNIGVMRFHIPNENKNYSAKAEHFNHNILLKIEDSFLDRKQGNDEMDLIYEIWENLSLIFPNKSFLIITVGLGRHIDR